MIRQLTCSARYFHQRPVYALIDQELHCRPARHGHAGSQESAFFLPMGGTPDGRGEEKSGHKAARARLSLDLEPDSPLGSLWICPWAQHVCNQFDWNARAKIRPANRA